MIIRERKGLARWYLVIVFFFLCLILGGAVVLSIYQFRLKRIEVVGDGMKAEINERLLMGNTLFFPSDAIRTQLLSSYPQFSDVEIQKKIPDTVLIIPLLRTPVAQLVTQTAVFNIDKDGVVIGSSDELLSPRIVMNVPYVRLGGVLKDERVLGALEFLRTTKDIINTNEITMADTGSLRAKTDETNIFFSHNSDMESVARSLQTLLSGIRIKGIMPKVIDVRFTKPIIQW